MQAERAAEIERIKVGWWWQQLGECCKRIQAAQPDMQQ
jgi:hypothetical protein